MAYRDLLSKDLLLECQLLLDLPILLWDPRWWASYQFEVHLLME